MKTDNRSLTANTTRTAPLRRYRTRDRQRKPSAHLPCRGHLFKVRLCLGTNAQVKPQLVSTAAHIATRGSKQAHHPTQ